MKHPESPRVVYNHSRYPSQSPRDLGSHLTRLQPKLRITEQEPKFRLLSSIDLSYWSVVRKDIGRFRVFSFDTETVRKTGELAYMVYGTVSGWTMILDIRSLKQEARRCRKPDNLRHLLPPSMISVLESSDFVKVGSDIAGDVSLEDNITIKTTLCTLDLAHFFTSLLPDNPLQRRPGLGGWSTLIYGFSYKPKQNAELKAMKIFQPVYKIYDWQRPLDDYYLGYLRNDALMPIAAIIHCLRSFPQYENLPREIFPFGVLDFLRKIQLIKPVNPSPILLLSKGEQSTLQLWQRKFNIKENEDESDDLSDSWSSSSASSSSSSSPPSSPPPNSLTSTKPRETISGDDQLPGRDRALQRKRKAETVMTCSVKRKRATRHPGPLQLYSKINHNNFYVLFPNVCYGCGGDHNRSACRKVYEPCNYPYCNDDQRQNHSIKICQILHGRCYKCKNRGHTRAHCFQFRQHELQFTYRSFAKHGKYTSQFEVNPEWDYYPPSGQTSCK